jgi:hypothetical protein
MPHKKAGNSAADCAPKHIDNRHGKGPIFQESEIREIIGPIYNQTKQGSPENSLETGSCSRENLHKLSSSKVNSNNIGRQN